MKHIQSLVVTTVALGVARSGARVAATDLQLDLAEETARQIRSGGDSGEGELQGSPPTQAPLALYSGIVTVSPDGTAETSFDIPAFNGTECNVRIVVTPTGFALVRKDDGEEIVERRSLT